MIKILMFYKNIFYYENNQRLNLIIFQARRKKFALKKLREKAAVRKTVLLYTVVCYGKKYNTDEI